MNTTTEERVSKILATVSGMDSIRLNQSLVTDLGLNSLRAVEVIIAIEDEFEILFKQSDMSFHKLKTVRDLVALVETYL